MALAVLALPHPGQAQTVIEKAAALEILRTKQNTANSEAAIFQTIRAGEFKSAQDAITRAFSKHGETFGLWVMQAIASMSLGQEDATMEALASAVDLGFPGLEQLMTSPLFAPVLIHPDMTALLATSAENATKAARSTLKATGGAVTLDFDNIDWLPVAKRFLAKIETAQTNAPIVKTDATDPELLFLRRLAQQGKAGGLQGVLYDNRDAEHSPFPHEDFPQLTRVFYSEGLKHDKLHYGPPASMLFPLVTFGNSSTAFRGVTGRSISRAGMTQRGGPQAHFLNYANDHIYVFPEHKDHDAHDRFPANWPYTFISQGSSYLDQHILRPVALILAALSAETRARLDAENLVAPTVQMIFRRAQTNIRSDQAYLSGLAHPTAFDRTDVASMRMMQLAASISADEIPPVVTMAVTSEDFRGKAGLAGRSEKLFDTPAAIARLWRGFEWEKQITLSTASTIDPNGHDLTFHWVLLRGDPEKVKIEPSADGRSAEIKLNWHDVMKVSPREAQTTSRVDIGVFAHNGFHFSAPSFLSVDFPAHQLRRYGPDGDGEMKLSEIDYDAISRDVYFDPKLYWSAAWRDQMSHDAENEAINIVRTFKNGDERKITISEKVGEPDFAYKLEIGASKLPELQFLGK
jgi:hypothetical protein